MKSKKKFFVCIVYLLGLSTVFRCLHRGVYCSKRYTLSSLCVATLEKKPTNFPCRNQKIVKFWTPVFRCPRNQSLSFFFSLTLIVDPTPSDTHTKETKWKVVLYFNKNKSIHFFPYLTFKRQTYKRLYHSRVRVEQRRLCYKLLIWRWINFSNVGFNYRKYFVFSLCLYCVLRHKSVGNDC